MKKFILVIFFTIMLFSACGTIRVSDVTALNTGMTQSQVNSIMGNPVRILSTQYYEDGVEQSFEYHTYYYEAYAVTFWNGRLSGYDFMYEVVPPAGIIPPNRPIPNRPHYPNKPSQPNRPNRPTEPSRPTQPSRPSRPERPTELPSRPTTRPETKPENGNTGGRPTYGQGSSRPTYNRQEDSKTKQEDTKTKEEQKKE